MCVCSFVPRVCTPLRQSIREHALHVLRLLAELMPNELLNAHKTSVLVALAAAIEDRKRCVRRAAVRCRNTWYAFVCEFVDQLRFFCNIEPWFVFLKCLVVVCVLESRECD
jgi:hypothetical protein